MLYFGVFSKIGFFTKHFLFILTFFIISCNKNQYYAPQSIKKLKKEEKEWALNMQGFIPTYKRELITDALHDACGFRTDYQFITKSKMKTIQKRK